MTQPKTDESLVYTGTPCRRYGHTLRYVSTTACVECTKLTNKAKYSANKKEYNKLSREYYLKNRESILRQAAIQYQESAEEKKARVAQYRRDNPEKLAESQARYAESNRDVLAERSRRWRKNNPVKANYYSSMKRARKKNATPPWLTEWDKFVIEEYYYKAKKLTETTGVEWHVDHIHPLNGTNLSGLHVPYNLQLLPASVNMRKSNKVYEEIL